MDSSETAPIGGRDSSEETGQIPQPSADSSAVPGEDPLYAHRAALAVDEPEPEERSKPSPLLLALLGAALLAALVPIGFSTHSHSSMPQTTVITKDLGTKTSNSAGIGGRLILQWKGSASYRLAVDPVEPAGLPAFESFAGNLPHVVIFAITLKDSSGGTVCQRQVVAMSSTAPGSSAQAQNPNALATATGDTMQGVLNGDGKTAELILSGPIPCQLEAFQRLASWEFSTDFPPLSGQTALLTQQSTASTLQSDSAHRGGGRVQFATVKSLPAPIEGDDAVVSDNPSKGILSTSGGRTFVLGADLRRGAFSWRAFPGRIHYRCEKNGSCALTNTESGVAVSARLMR